MHFLNVLEKKSSVFSVFFRDRKKTEKTKKKLFLLHIFTQVAHVFTQVAHKKIQKKFQKSFETFLGKNEKKLFLCKF